MAAAKKGGLGRGLEALFNENATDEKGVVTLRLSEIEPNRNQPRTSFDDEALTELADSIQKHGLIQPIVVRPTSSGVYQIVAGERRWRACRMADLQEVPVVIKELDDKNYYDALSAKEFINLKKALGNINNIITLKATLAFVDKLASYNLIEGSVVEQIKEKINSQSANANGFDILCEEGDFPFVAEVKCNIPVEKDKFGPAELGGIYKDIINLSQGKGKVDVDVTKFNKFMVRSD